MEDGIETPADEVLTGLKKERLDLRDQIAEMLREANAWPPPSPPARPMSADPKAPFELKERFVWKWHPHGWLIGLLILLLIILFRSFAQ